MDEIIWKDVCDFEGLYLVSNTGLIKSLISNIILKQGPTSKFYAQVGLYKNGIKTTKNVHRIVTESFFGKSTLDVNHKDCNKRNNNISNLEQKINYLNRNNLDNNRKDK